MSNSTVTYMLGYHLTTKVDTAKGTLVNSGD